MYSFRTGLSGCTARLTTSIPVCLLEQKGDNSNVCGEDGVTNGAWGFRIRKHGVTEEGDFTITYYLSETINQEAVVKFTWLTAICSQLLVNINTVYADRAYFPSKEILHNCLMLDL